MIVLEAFSPKEIRTCARLLRRSGKLGLTAIGIVKYADYLAELGAVTPDGIRSIKRLSRKRTPEEITARKQALVKTKYGSIKVKP